MKQYHDLLQRILDEGVEKGDRTGTGTISIFGHQMRFNLKDGFPLLTTKKMFTRGMVEELLYFIGGVDNNNILKEKNVKIWDQWGDKNGNLGAMYGHQLRNFGGKYENIPQPIPKRILYFELPKNLDISNKYKSKYGDYVIIGNGIKKGYLRICFLSTGYQYETKLERVKSGKVYDPYYPSKHNFGGLGDVYKNRSEYEKIPFFKKAENIWLGMVSRCYNEKKDHYVYYGGKGVHVCDRWQILSNFIKDFKYIRGFDDDFENLELDKDIIGNGFVYSIDSCILINKKSNMRAKKDVTYTIKHDSGMEVNFENSVEFRENFNIKNQGNFDSMLRGERNVCEGWSLVNKIQKGVDQLKDAIELIKKDPNSRRNVITLWNPMDLKYQALACCHGTVIQFYVSNGKLSCSTYQRSADSFLGVPFNIASYALLTMMVAQVCDLKYGDLIYSFGDTHIYSNHIEQVKKQLTREPYPLPTMKINPNIKDIEAFTINDFELDGYKCHPAIKGDVSV